MGRVILFIVGTGLAALLQWGWGAVFWALTPIPNDYMIQTLPPEPEQQVRKALTDANLESGRYFSPKPSDRTSQEAFQKKHVDGPIFQIIYRKDGLTPIEMGLTYLAGYFHFFGCSLMAGFLLLAVNRSLWGYFGRLLFVTFLGVFAVAATRLGDPIWFHHPWKFELFLSGFEVIGWFLAAIVLAAFVRPPKKLVAARPSKPPPLMPEQFHPSDRVHR